MTGPGPIAEPPAEIAEIVGSAVQQLGLDPQAYGFAWRLRIATVINSDPLYARFDGDVTGDPLRMDSMVGTVLTGSRVYVLTVPPAGNFAISYVDNPFAVDTETQTLLSGLVAASTGAEVAVPSASYAAEPLFTFRQNSIYRLTLQCGLYSTDGTDVTTTVRIRQGQENTSGTRLVLSVQHIPAQAVSQVHSTLLVGYCKNTTSSDITSYLTVTNDLVGGLGAHSQLFGNTDIPFIMEKQLIGAATDYADLAFVTISLV